MRRVTIIISVLLASLFIFGSASADYCSICVKDYCQTTYSTDNDGDGDGMSDAYEMELVKQSKSPLCLDRSSLTTSQMMDASMSNGSLHFLWTKQNSFVTAPFSEVNPESLKLKDPNTAAFYALFPGFFVHGAGHFYAGKSGTAVVLLGVEMLSIGSFYLYGLASLPDESSDNYTNQAVFLSMAVGLFLGSWYYDIMKTPQAVKEYNEKLRTKNK